MIDRMNLTGLGVAFPMPNDQRFVGARNSFGQAFITQRGIRRRFAYNLHWGS